jgi:hypothetical protein
MMWSNGMDDRSAVVPKGIGPIGTIIGPAGVDGYINTNVLHHPDRLEVPVERVLDMSGYPQVVARLG